MLPVGTRIFCMIYVSSCNNYADSAQPLPTAGEELLIDDLHDRDHDLPEVCSVFSDVRQPTIVLKPMLTL